VQLAKLAAENENLKAEMQKLKEALAGMNQLESKMEAMKAAKDVKPSAAQKKGWLDGWGFSPSEPTQTPTPEAAKPVVASPPASPEPVEEPKAAVSVPAVVEPKVEAVFVFPKAEPVPALEPKVEPVPVPVVAPVAVKAPHAVQVAPKAAATASAGRRTIEEIKAEYARKRMAG